MKIMKWLKTAVLVCLWVAPLGVLSLPRAQADASQGAALRSEQSHEFGNKGKDGQETGG
jgi:hypothetical protein